MGVVRGRVYLFFLAEIVLAGASRLPFSPFVTKNQTHSLIESPTDVPSLAPSVAPTFIPVDTTTLHGKIMAGYQGWFSTPGDGGLDTWKHWSNTGDTPNANDVHVAMWPDMREYDDDELHDTDFRDANNRRKVGLYSAYHRKTIFRHLRWMSDYGIDGVFVQRFLVAVRDFRYVRDTVLDNVRRGAERHGRVFVNMWDISGKDLDGIRLVSDIIADWKHLVDDMKITESPSYLHHKGQPLVSIWGFGFKNRQGTPAQALSLIEWFHTTPIKKYRATVMGGVVTDWREALEPGGINEWTAMFKAFDIISPWTVGRMKNMDDVPIHRRQNWEPDLATTRRHDIDYFPVVYPGFSFHNAANGAENPFNVIPRLGGRFFWSQLHHAARSGATAIYVAMFDEVDEGTAIYKVAESNQHVPAQGRFVTLDQDNPGVCVPSDWYLTLTGIATRYFRSTATDANTFSRIPKEMPAVPEGACDWAEEDNGNGGGTFEDLLAILFSLFIEVAVFVTASVLG